MADPSSRPAGSPVSPLGDLLPVDVPADAAGAVADGVSGAPVRASVSGTTVRAPSSEPATPESFERALGELEQIVQRMENGSMSLEDSLVAYRRGAALVAYCRKSLSEVQQQVRILEADLLRPFDADVRAEGDMAEGTR